MMSVRTTAYGFEYGPMLVERVAHDDRLGWVVVIRPRDAYEPNVYVRISPKGRRWSVESSLDSGKKASIEDVQQHRVALNRAEQRVKELKEALDEISRMNGMIEMANRARAALREGNEK